MIHSRRWLLVLGVAFLCALPAVLTPSLLNAAIQMMIAALFATAFNVLCGQGGMLSFGHAAYFGIGTFATVHAMSAVGGSGLLPTPLLPLAGAVAGWAVGWCAGWFSTKRSGVYFAMITLALAELLHALAPQLKGLFGGEAGLSTMRQPSLGLSFGPPLQVYYLSMGWVLLSLALLYGYTRTPAGRLTLGLRENAHRLQFLGYDVHRQSVFTFSVSAMFCGIAGGLQAISNESASYVLFDLRLSAEVVLNAFIGGVKVFLGPALGAAVMTFFGYALSDLTRSWLLYQGVLFVLLMMFAPGGIAGLVQDFSRQARQHGLRRLVRPVAMSLVAGALVLAASVFTIELVQRLASSDYRGRRVDGNWPPIPLLGREWAPDAFTTWALPLCAAAVGFLAARYALAAWRRLREAPPAPAAVPGLTSPMVGP